MKVKLRGRALSFVVTSMGLGLSVAGCGDLKPDDAGINVAPLTQEEATESLQRISERPGDPAAQAALHQLQPALDRLNGLIARIEPQAGHFISFYEPSPGQLMVSERGPLGSQRLLPTTNLGGQSVVDIYQRLTGSEAPSALAAAQARASAAIASGADDGPSPAGQALASSPADAQPAPDGTAAVRSALTESDGPWFAANGCFVYGAGFADSTGCFPDWWNGGYAQWSTKTSFFTVAPFSGDGVSVRMQYSGSTQFQDPVFTGDWLSWWYHSSVYNTVNGPQYNMRTHRWDILNASGDGFHWSYAFKWNCSGTYGCDQWPTH